MKYFEIYKHIPEEKYIYSLRFNQNGVLIKGIKGVNSCMGDKERISFSFNSEECKKELIRPRKELINRYNILDTDDIETIEFSTLRQAVYEADKIYILVKKSSDIESNEYYQYQVKGCK